MLSRKPKSLSDDILSTMRRRALWQAFAATVALVTLGWALWQAYNDQWAEATFFLVMSGLCSWRADQ